MHTGRPRNPGVTKLGTKLSYPLTLIKKYLSCHDPALMARFWPKSCHFCLFLSLFRHFFGCHGHKYAYFRHRSHMHLLWTYTKLVWSSFGHRHASVMNTGASKTGDFWVKIRSQWQGRSGAGIHCGNSLAPQITSILIGKHDLGPFWPLPSFPYVHGGVKNGWFWGQNQVTMAGSSRDPGIIMKTL